MKKPKGILFDYDGVIADTMEDNFLAWKRAFHNFNIEIKRSDYFPLEGYSSRKISQIISKKYRLNINPQDVSDLKHHYYLTLNKFKLYPKIKKILNFLQQKKVFLGLITGAERRRLESSIPSLIHIFDIIITGEEKIKEKPMPDPYLLATKRLSLEPKDCLVIENAPLGIRSAKAAGCYCIAMTTTVKKNYIQGADKIIESHSDLLHIFQKKFT